MKTVKQLQLSGLLVLLTLLSACPGKFPAYCAGRN